MAKRLSILSKKVKSKTESTLGEQLGSSVVDWTKRGASGLLNMLNPAKAASSMTKSKSPWFSKIGSGRITAIKSDDSIADVLAKIYNFLDNTHREDVVARELEVAARKEELEENGVRHKKMIDALRNTISHKKEEIKGAPEKQKGTLAGFVKSIVGGVFSLFKGIFSGIMLAFKLVSLGIGAMMTAISAIGTLVGVIFSLAKTLKILSLLFSSGGFNILKTFLISPIAIPLAASAAVIGGAAIVLKQASDNDQEYKKEHPELKGTSLKDRRTTLPENTYNPKPTERVSNDQEYKKEHPELKGTSLKDRRTTLPEKDKEIVGKRLSEYNRNLGLSGKKPVSVDNPNFLEYLKTFPEDAVGKVNVNKSPLNAPVTVPITSPTTPTAVPEKPAEVPMVTPTAVPEKSTDIPSAPSTIINKPTDSSIVAPSNPNTPPKPNATAQSLTKPIPELTDPVTANLKQNQSILSTTNTKNTVFGKPSKTQYTAIPVVRDNELYKYCFNNAGKI